MSRTACVCLKSEEVQSGTSVLLVVRHRVPCLNLRLQYGEPSVHADNHAVEHVYDILTKCT